jgi:hypothetical protein
MIKLTDRSFAPVAIVLSFVAAMAIDQVMSCLLFKFSPILSGRLTCHLTKCSGEIGLAGKIKRKRDFNQGLISACQ